MKKAIVGIGVFVLIIGVLLVALPFDYVPKTKSEAYQVPQSTVVDLGSLPHFTNNPVNTVTEGYSLNAGDSLNIQVNVTSGIKMNLSINNGSATLLSYNNFTTLNVNWAVPQNSDYNFVFSSSSMFTYNNDSYRVTKNWNTTAYRDVTQNVPLLPFQVLYFGIGITLSGVAITMYGTILKKDRSVI
jgi:hypothetical protein